MAVLTEPQALALAGASAASAGLTELAEFARDPFGDGPDQKHLTLTDVVENLADACKLAIEASGRSDEEAMQLLAALSKYLDGWAV